jgi:hypothetical protein
MEVDRLRDPQRVALRATRLGMVPLVNPAFIRLGDGTQLGDPVPASTADRERLTPRATRKPPSLRLPPVLVYADVDPDAGGSGAPSDEPAGTEGTKRNQ